MPCTRPRHLCYHKPCMCSRTQCGVWCAVKRFWGLIDIKVCQKPALFLLVQMSVLSRYFSVFIILGIYNFALVLFFSCLFVCSFVVAHFICKIVEYVNLDVEFSFIQNQTKINFQVFFFLVKNWTKIEWALLWAFRWLNKMNKSETMHLYFKQKVITLKF